MYTVMKTIQDISAILGQTKSVVTFNLTIYTKAKEIQWRRPDEFKHLVIRMGGFQIALHYLSVVGKKFEESGIADLLMESGLYGTTSTTALLKGKSWFACGQTHHGSSFDIVVKSILPLVRECKH